MRKAVSLFLAAAVLCLSTSAMASPTAGSITSTVRNGDTSMPSSASSTSTMPCFRPGDTITFNVSSLTSGEQLTVISYKEGSSASDSTVQYINQYTVSGDQTVSYTIRSQASGVYKLVFNGSVNGTANFYYKVGNATMKIINGNGNGGGSYVVNGPGSPYRIYQDPVSDNYSVGFIGKVTIDSGDISLMDIDANPGFEITESGGKTHKYNFGSGVNSGKTVANLNDLRGSGIEVSGSYSFIYGLTLYNITGSTSTSRFTATAVLDD